MFSGGTGDITKDQYFDLCEQLGNEPIPEEVPRDYSDLPYEVQVALDMYSYLPDIFGDMSGSFIGKDLSIIPYLFQVFDVENEKVVLEWIKTITNIQRLEVSNQIKRKQKKHAK